MLNDAFPIEDAPVTAAISGKEVIPPSSSMAITSVVPGVATVVQGTLGIIALALTAGGIAIGDSPILGVGAWSLALFVFVLCALALASHYAKHSPWRADRSTIRAGARAWHEKRSAPATVETPLEREPLAKLMSQTLPSALSFWWQDLRSRKRPTR
jgi:hypothetical protein